jgi:hypothetical protein
MKAMTSTSHQAVNAKTRQYIGLALSLLLLGNAAAAGMPAMAAPGQATSAAGSSKLIVAEATPPGTSKNTDDDDKKAEKQKRKQEKQEAKAAEKAKKEDSKSKKDDDKSGDKTKKDDDKAVKKDEKSTEKSAEKSKKDEKDAEKEKEKEKDKSKKDEKAKASEKAVKSEKAANATRAKESAEDAKKEGEESKTAETDTRIEAPPAYVPDAALISVLKDLNRSLKESEEFTKIEDPAQKAVAELAHHALRKAMEDSQVSANRIVEKVGKDNSMPPMGTEAWSSGELDLGDDGKAALSAVWAKRENGLMMVTIAGTTDKKAPNGKKIGEYVVVLSARSSVENGFDIQSQQNVSFWLGKVASISIESDCVPPPLPPAAEGEQPKAPNKVSEDAEAVKKKSLIVLPVVLTSRRREYLAALMAVEKHNAEVAARLAEAAKAEADAKAAEGKSDAKPESSGAADQLSDLPPGVEAKTMQAAYERALRAVAMKELMKMTPNSEGDKAGAEKVGAAGTDTAGVPKTDSSEAVKNDVNGVNAAKATQKENAAGANGQGAADKTIEAAKASAQTGARTQTSTQTQTSITAGQTTQAQSAQTQTAQQPVASAQQGQTSSSNQVVSSNQTIGQGGQPQSGQQQVAMLPANGTTVINPGPDNVSAFRAVRQPSVGAMMMVPERALAGQSMTISIYDSKRNPEASVELSLNGSTMISNIDGQVSFTIPEDATPGRSLNVALAARPEVMPTVIDILQPLIVPSEKQSPSIEGVSLTGNHNDTLVINGHFFDGIAPNNKISIDGQAQGRIAAASPVELRVSLPITLQGGEHSVVVSCDGLSSNSGTFVTEAPPSAPPSAPELKKKNKPAHF